MWNKKSEAKQDNRVIMFRKMRKPINLHYLNCHSDNEDFQ